MPKLSKFAATALIASSTTAVLTEPAQAVVIRYESTFDPANGEPILVSPGLLSNFPTFGQAPYSVAQQDIFGDRPITNSDTAYIQFEFDTETRGFSNYIIDMGHNNAISNGEVTFFTGLGIERTIAVEDAGPPAFANNDFFAPAAEVIPAQGGEPARTRIRFLANRGTNNQRFGFVLELNADLFALETGGRVDISPFTPDQALPITSGLTPSQLLDTDGLDFAQPLSSIFNGGRSGTFGISTVEQDDGSEKIFQIAGLRTEDLNRFGDGYLLGTVIPEPTSLAMLAAGGLLMAGRRRRRDERV